MSVIEEPPANNAPTPAATDAHPPAADNASAAKPHDQTQTATAGESPKPADISVTADVADDAATTTTSKLPEAGPVLSQPALSVTPLDAQVAEAEPTPELPPRPEPQEYQHTMATTTAVQTNHPIPTQGVDAVAAQGERVSPQVEALRAMFPDFDVAVLQSVLDSVNGDQERALDVLLGMSDPEYVSTQPVQQPEQHSLDLDEQLARQLMLEDQQQEQRHASGTSWPRRGAGEFPYQQRQQPHGSPTPDSDNAGERPNDQFQEFQRTMGQIAESGKRTFSSIVTRVKAKINEYEQSRNVNAGQASAASTAPQWGAAPPAPVDRHTAQEAYQQQYFAASNAPAQPPVSSARDPPRVSGYDLDEPVVQNQSAAVASPIPTPAAPPAQSPRASSDVPRPPPTNSGSPVNPAKIGLLPKRPVSLMNTSSPPVTRPSDDDDELEYVENPFEEHK